MFVLYFLISFCMGIAGSALSKTTPIPDADYQAFYTAMINNDVNTAEKIYIQYKDHKHKSKLFLTKQNEFYGIHHAAAKGNKEVITYLCSLLTPESKKIILNLKAPYNETALFYAIKFNHHETVKLLLHEGANWKENVTNQNPPQGATPFYTRSLPYFDHFAFACINHKSDKAMIELFIQHFPEQERLNILESTHFCYQHLMPEVTKNVLYENGVQRTLLSGRTKTLLSVLGFITLFYGTLFYIVSQNPEGAK